MKDKLYNYFKNLFNNDKIGHAFLICNCNLSFIEEELNRVLSDFFFKKTIDINNNEDICIINPENNIIKKEKIQQIQEEVLLTSQVNNFKIYIINECEKMNDSAANSLLKLLEEPENNIFAFLISSNVLNVIPTIYSRCQILNFYNEDLSNSLIKNIEEEDLDDIIKMVDLIETKKEKTIAYYSFISKKIKDRTFLKKLFTVLLFIYRDSLNIKLENKIEYFDNIEIINKIAYSNKENEIIYKLTKISKYINLIDYNLNTNLLLDRFIIELVGESYE